jgi:hypothetical protein
MNTPVACSLRVAAYPLKGATPAARQSRFRGVPGWGFGLRTPEISVCTQRGSVTGMLRVEAVAHRRRANAGFGRAA